MLYSMLVTAPLPAVGRLPVTAPFDGGTIAEVELAGEASVERALAAARDCFAERGGWLSATRRLDILERSLTLLRGEAERLTQLATREGGKPLKDSRIEMARAIDGIRLCIQCIRAGHGEEVPMDINAASGNRLAFTHHEPIGPVVAFSAFNHPLNLIVHQIGPAIAAGCPVIVKPADDTPLSCYELVRIFHQAGLPEPWCQALSTPDHRVAGMLAADARVAFFSFIGSAGVGWMLRSRLAPGTRCALEHGGIAPVIVAADADLDSAVPLLVKGGFYHAGQVCISVQRIYAHRSLAGELARRLAAAADALVVGDPLHDATDVGPLIRPAEVERVHAWVNEAVAAGAEKLCGGEPAAGNCYRPTVLVDPPDDARVSCDEVFGPVVCVYPFDDLDAALTRANGLDFAFHAAVFTRSLDTAMQAYRGLAASAVLINDHTAFRVDWMPFAGLRHSGLGVGGIPYTFDEMRIRKLMVIRSKGL